jgi:hypothetical protein
MNSHQWRRAAGEVAPDQDDRFLNGRRFHSAVESEDPELPESRREIGFGHLAQLEYGRDRHGKILLDP